MGRIVPEDDVNWNVVRMIVQGYSERHPEEVAGCYMYVADIRSKLKNEEFASLDSDAHARHIYELPPALKDALSMKYPEVLKGDNLKHFLELFPKFQIPEKV